MSKMPDGLADQNWQPGNKFSPLIYLKHWCYKALYLALVGRSSLPAEALPIPVRSEPSSAPPRRTPRR